MVDRLVDWSPKGADAELTDTCEMVSQIAHILVQNIREIERNCSASDIREFGAALQRMIMPKFHKNSLDVMEFREPILVQTDNATYYRRTLMVDNASHPKRKIFILEGDCVVDIYIGNVEPQQMPMGRCSSANVIINRANNTVAF